MITSYKAIRHTVYRRLAAYRLGAPIYHRVISGPEGLKAMNELAAKAGIVGGASSPLMVD